MTESFHIGIDARWIFPEISGIGMYTRELIRHLAQIEQPHRYTLFFNRADLQQHVLRETGVENHSRFSASILSDAVFSIAGQWRVTAEIHARKLDVFHSPNFMIPLPAFPRGRTGSTACVTTLHDLIPLLFPHFAPRSKKTRFFPLYRLIMKEVARRSTLILTDSEHSRRDVLSSLRTPDQKVRAIYMGVSPRFAADETHAPASNSVALLYIGRMDPYKNVAGVIRVAARLRELTSRPIHVRIVGPPDARYPEAPELVRELGLETSVRWDGYLPDDDLVAAYRQANVLLLLSRYEGFGLPVAEAMAAGTPVVCSNVSSLPEIAGDAALLVKPDDIEGAAQAVMRILQDPRLAADMRRKGRAQAARFTWEKTARETLKAYEDAAKRRKG